MSPGPGGGAGGDPAPVEDPRGLTALTVVAALAGGLVGVVVAGFRVLLQALDAHRVGVSHWATASGPAAMLLVVLGCATCAAVASLLVTRIEPHISGSGMPRVIGVARGELPAGRLRILPLKFLGSVLTLGSGMTLGRGGPSVQMGGVIAQTVGRWTRRPAEDLRILAASGAAAGLATAFNAPIAGGVFVLEELLKRFDARATVVTLVASATGFLAAWGALGTNAVLYTPGPIAPVRIEHVPWVLLVGILAGLCGVLANRGFVRGLTVMEGLPGRPVVKAAVVGGLVGVLVLTAPSWTGVGDDLVEEALQGRGTIAVIALLLLVRLVAGWLCHATGVPGGLFGPILVLGANLGLLVGLVAQVVAPHTAPSPAALALVGIAAFFASSLQAPLTGITIAFEIAGVTSQLVPMLAACALAMLVATLLRDAPLFDALAARTVRGETHGPERID